MCVVCSDSCFSFPRKLNEVTTVCVCVEDLVAPYGCSLPRLFLWFVVQMSLGKSKLTLGQKPSLLTTYVCSHSH